MNEITLRRAEMRDRENLFTWRNAPEIRAVSFSMARVERPEHEAWFERTTKNPKQHLLIGELDGEPVGVIRFDDTDTGTETEISIYVVPGTAGRGYGTRLLVSSAEWARDNIAGLERIIARVKPDNVASLKAFKNAGYVPYRDALAWETGTRK